ncbi:predicted protein [Chaetomium globosum CBS 148.51]|uniref:Uncharacterized protein n=1 Tax=Chaetomium globosum (strain ATCC 6205 / CBS 148.51 / DSM 1962 / NBRC 6347 / NRRL 1970) TaxID=306901 RepID=Q2GVA7_CHAGB|nr:uncharacterized protein CHGG_08097 [Chaetomium globosum CBS 148.51]EAQ86844.1 predicted protein [Chaetomium globosum CBS 148.51]
MEAESDNQTPGSSSTPSVPTPSVPTPSVVAALPTPPPPGKDRQQHGKGYDEEKPCGQFQQKTADCTCESHSTNTYNDFEIIVDSRPTEGQAPVPKKNQFTKRPEVSKLDRVLNDVRAQLIVT